MAQHGTEVESLESPLQQQGPKHRSGKPPNHQKPVYQRWWIWTLIGLGAATSGTILTMRQTLNAVEQGLPEVGSVLTYVRDGTLTLKASDGEILQQIGPATRDRVQFEQIPPLLTRAFIAAEDKNFYEHEGIDYRAIARALYTNVVAGEVVEGGSTITQQLARIVFLDQNPTLERKLREALLAQKIERELSKETILERYLSLVYLGSGAYGVADAAWIYFSKSVDELTLPEMAMIAGLAPAPSLFSPLVDSEAARRRRDLTLERMAEAEFITTDEMSAAMATPLEINPSLPKYFISDTPYFTSYVQQQLTQLLPPEDLELGGLTVETTLNIEWQAYAEEAVRKAIEEYGPGQGFEQAALVSIDPRTGEIRAMVGGDDFNESQFNRVTQAMRQPGSTFKTLVYTTAIAGGLSPYKTYEDAKFSVDGYEPHNYEDRYRGTVSIRDALISSLNVVAVKTLIDVGFDPVIEMAQRMGIKSELYPTYSLALGASEVNLLELTSAYGTLANLGNTVEPHGIVRILNRYNEVIYEANPTPARAVDKTTTAIMTWMLQGVVQNGTGRRAQLGRPVAGKTGTSEERRDLWFVGYIPQLVTGVWLGNDDNRPTWGASGTAAQTWRDFMAQIVEAMPVEEFPDLPRLDGREATIELQPVKPKQRRDRLNENNDNDADPPSRETSDQPSEEETVDESRSDNREPEPSRSRGRNAGTSGRDQEDSADESESDNADNPSPQPSSSPRGESPTPASPTPPSTPPSADPAPPPVPEIPVTEPVAPAPTSQPSVEAEPSE
jgi:penicillin-binding protein 1A